jgi:Asp-tRNA(Asn)/Glu-tRNA(Gln) amidotransferase A subunit family amidase
VSAAHYRRPWSLRALVDDLRTGRTTPAAAYERARARIAETEPDLRAWVELSDRPGPGAIPLGVKDIIDVAGLPTRCGSVLRADSPAATADAAVVSAWRRAGAAPIGKTVTTEFAFFSPGPTRNPAAPGHTPGGSSSGSAAAVAAGQVPLAIGSQTAGSVTRPAAYCGVASLVMTHGRFSTDGVTGLAGSLDAHGFYAATASDLAVAWSALTGEPDPATRFSTPLRLLVWRADPLGVVSDEMAAAVEAFRERAVRVGAQADAFPEEQLIAEVTAAHPVIMAYEAARERTEEAADPDRLSRPLADLLRIGATTSDADYRAALGLVARARTEVGRVFSEYDAVLGPAAPGAAPAGLAATGDPVLSRAWQALGVPALALPGARDARGLPLGLQLLGAHGREGHLLTVGTRLEGTRP